MSMHVCMHVCICVSMHNRIQMNDEFVFFSFNWSEGEKNIKNSHTGGEDLFFAISLNL